MTDTLLMWIGAILGIFVGRKVYRKHKMKAQRYIQLIETAKAKGNYTEAVAVQRNLHYGDRGNSDPELRAPSMHVTYEFRIHGEVYYKSLIFQDRGKTYIDYPETVTIYYDPCNIKEAICREELAARTYIGKRLAPAIGVGVLVMVGTYCLLGKLLG